MASKLLGKSGNLRPILYYESRGLLWQLYKRVHPDIAARAQSEEGLCLHDHPRYFSTESWHSPGSDSTSQSSLAGATCVTFLRGRENAYQTFYESWQWQGHKTSWKILCGSRTRNRHSRLTKKQENNTGKGMHTSGSGICERGRRASSHVR